MSKGNGIKFIRFKQSTAGSGEDKEWTYMQLPYVYSDIDEVEHYLSEVRILHDWSEHYRGVKIQRVSPSKLPKLFVKKELDVACNMIHVYTKNVEYYKKLLTNK